MTQSSSLRIVCRAAQSAMRITAIQHIARNNNWLISLSIVTVRVRWLFGFFSTSRSVSLRRSGARDFIGVSAQGFGWIARIDPLAQIPRTSSQTATAFAIRELHFATISNDVVDCSVLHACIYKVWTEKSAHTADDATNFGRLVCEGRTSTPRQNLCRGAG